jgi:hypothetical protein
MKIHFTRNRNYVSFQDTLQMLITRYIDYFFLFLNNRSIYSSIFFALKQQIKTKRKSVYQRHLT